MESGRGQASLTFRGLKWPTRRRCVINPSPHGAILFKLLLDRRRLETILGQTELFKHFQVVDIYQGMYTFLASKSSLRCLRNRKPAVSRHFFFLSNDQVEEKYQRLTERLGGHPARRLRGCASWNLLHFSELTFDLREYIHIALGERRLPLTFYFTVTSVSIASRKDGNICMVLEGVGLD